MAEMERPVMEVTRTESRMMTQVRTAGVGEDVIAPKLSGGLSQVRSHVRNLSWPTDSPCDLSRFPSLSLGFLIGKMGLCLPPDIF